MKRRTKERGFALVAALLANLILLAVGIIAINLSTGDIRISMKSVGDKKAVNAAESGLHWLTVNFDATTPAALIGSDNQVDPATDPNSRYVINNITDATTGPAQVPLPGFSIGGSQMWGLARYDARITGTNTAYNTTLSIDVGLGYGPVEMGTMSR
ncbi:MAG TPA: hypothetical protein VMB77_12770 [Syntrophales bacterium]|nr:hypothetical protein [Syntrophales bacterium]